MGPNSHTDLILNPDGSIYHLHLLPGDIARTVILVGDPGRVRQVSDNFKIIEVQKENREFVTHTGLYKGKRITVLSTGIGTDNIDIVLNELDALVNVDLVRREIKPAKSVLRLIRLGTSGALHPEINAGAIILSRISCGFDGLYHYYKDETPVTIPGISDEFMKHTSWKEALPHPYFIKCSPRLAAHFENEAGHSGITISTPGFYAPQVRGIRLRPFDERLIDKIDTFKYEGLRINNFEMECSALYALAAMMGHQALTMCIAIANRITKSFLEDYKPHVDGLIRMTLDKLVEND
ncbi:MAG: nucleoside phosphorylase [Bacteroidetes bacterium]|nr:nucleoside phosphorylase [Bacteroidota bacterium]